MGNTMTLSDAIETIQDYPLYGHTDGLTKEEIMAIAKILKEGE